MRKLRHRLVCTLRGYGTVRETAVLLDGRHCPGVAVTRCDRCGLRLH